MNAPRRRAPAPHPAVGDAVIGRLHALWERYLASPAPLAVDRWLSANLRLIEGMKRADRLWIGERILDACRFASWVLFCESLVRSQGAAPDRHGSDPYGFAEANRRFHREFAREADAVAALRRLRPADFFFWLAMREALQPEKRPAAPPFWPASHSSPHARPLWDRVAGFFAQNDGLDALLVWNGIPPWLEPLVLSRAETSGWDEAQLKLFIRRHGYASPLWLRLNCEPTAEAVIAELAAHGLHPLRRGPAAVRVSGPEGIQRLDGYQAGRFEIQDFASQQIGLAAGCRPGRFVWDCCAGAGGKTLQLASLLEGRGAVYASDTDGRKLDTLRLRARHAGLSGSVRIAPWDGEALPAFPREVAARGGFDAVLADVPCSGSGTWRRNPDGRLFFHAERIAVLQERQLRILTTSAAAVRPGGRLVYATCSIADEENEEICRRFAEGAGSAAGFRLLSMALFGNPFEDSDTTFAGIFVRG